MKPGAHTSEFWTTAGTGAVAVLAGLLDHEEPAVVVAAIVGMAAVACTYTYARMRVKVESERCERLRP